MIVFFMVENYLGTLAVTLTVPSVLSFSGTTAVGVVTAVGGAGAVAGSLIVALWGGTARRATGMVGFVSGVGLGVVLVGLRPSVTVAAVGALVWWASMSILNAHWLAIIQIKVGPELQGRVLATNQMLAVAMTPLAFLTAPPLAEYFSGLLNPGGMLADTVGRALGTGPGRGTGLLLVTCGLLLIAWAVLGLRYRPLRYMEDELPDAVAGAEIAEDLDTLQAAADRAMPGGGGDRTGPDRTGGDGGSAGEGCAGWFRRRGRCHRQRPRPRARAARDQPMTVRAAFARTGRRREKAPRSTTLPVCSPR
ncbi:hypothetical protein [Kitasatospora sp. NPDC054795]